MMKNSCNLCLEGLLSKMELLKSTTPVSPVLRFVLEGGVGAGKTSILKKLGDRHPEWEVICEPIARWQDFNGVDYLQPFLKEPSPERGFELQKVVLKSYEELLLKDPSAKIQIYERSARSAIEIFGPAYHQLGNLGLENYKDLVEIYQDNNQQLEKIDGWVYLRTTPEICFSRMKKRGYPNSGPLTPSFTSTVHEFHEKFFADGSGHCGDGNILVLDESSGIEKSLDGKMEEVEKFILRVVQERVDVGDLE